MPAEAEPLPRRWRRAETELVLAVQRHLATPATTRAAQVLGHVGDHALGWIALGVLGAGVDGARRGRWAAATTAVVAAHGATVVVKRVLRRRRPDDPRVVVAARTPSRLSFPSSHAASTTAAALVYGRLLGTRATWPLVPVMALSRPLLGLHFPGDVVAGVAVGVAVDRVHAALRPGDAARRGGTR